MLDLSRSHSRVARINAFEISWMVTGLVTVNGNSKPRNSLTGAVS